MTWNMWSEDVARERQTQRELSSKYPRPSADSYKAQALRELAARLEQEETIKTLRSIVEASVDFMEAIEDLSLADDWQIECRDKLTTALKRRCR